MTQTLKYILNENRKLIIGASIPYMLFGGLMIGAEKGIISTPDVYAGRLYRAIAGESSNTENSSEYIAYIAIGRQVPVLETKKGFVGGDKINYGGADIEVLNIGFTAPRVGELIDSKTANVKFNEQNFVLATINSKVLATSPNRFKDIAISGSKALTLLDVYSDKFLKPTGNEGFLDFAVSNCYEMKSGGTINDFFCQEEMRLLSVSDSKAVVEIEGKESLDLKIGERKPTSKGVIITLLKIEK